MLSIGLVDLQLRPAMAVRAEQSAAISPPPTVSAGSSLLLSGVRVVLLACIAIVFLVIIASLFTKAGRRRVLFWTAALLVLLVVQALLSLVPPVARVGEQAFAPGQIAPPRPASEITVPFEQRPPRWLLWAAAAGCVLLASAGAAGVFVAVRARRPRGARARLAEQTRAAADALGRGADFRSVILRCYHEMSIVVREEMGIERERAVTPREFAVLLERWGLPAEPVRDLTAVFEEARYGRAEASPRREERALRSLSLIERYCREAS